MSEVGLFDKKAQQGLLSGAVIHLQSAKKWLADPYCQTQYELMKKHAKVAPELWDMMFKPLLEHMATYVQCFPDARYHNRAILQVSMTRCAAAMASIPSHASDRYRFALFSAALLLNLGIMHADYRIYIVNDQGDFIEEWSAFQGALHHYGQYCRVFPISNVPSQLVPHLTPVLAQTLMDVRGWQWLSEEPALLLQWLAFLSRSEGSGDLGNLLDMAEDKTKLESASMPAMPIESMQVQKTHLGEMFWQWIDVQSKQGTLSLNGEDSHVHDTKAGRVLEVESLARAFAKEKGESWREAVSQLAAMGVLRAKEGYAFNKTVSAQAANRQKSSLVRHSLFASSAKQAAKQQGGPMQGHVLKDAGLLKGKVVVSKHVKEVGMPVSTKQLNDRYKSTGQSLTQQLSNREGK